MSRDLVNSFPTFEIWERIAFHAVTLEGVLGPPSAICTLARLSRRIYGQVSINNNTHLYARLFHFKFDCAAPSRRLSERWRTARCLTAELIKRFQALKRIRAMEVMEDDLWTAYLMLLESDGKNEAQLEYSGLKKYLKSLIILRASPSHELSWFKNATVDSLVLWLLWWTSEREFILLDDNDYLQYLFGVLHSFITTGYRHSSVYGLDVVFELPLCKQVSPIHPNGFDKSPPRSKIIHYSHCLQLSIPVVSSAAILAVVVQSEAFQNTVNISNTSALNNRPANRAEAVALGWNDGPTAADILDFHTNNRIRAIRRSTLVSDPSYIEDLDSLDIDFERQRDLAIGTCGSACYDQDWYRLVSCYDPFLGNIPLRGMVYKLGTIGGTWAGRILSPDFENFTLLVNNQSKPSTVSIRHHPLYWELEEHHCLSPNYALPLGIKEDFGDDILNAWIPRGSIFTHVEDGLEVYDPKSGYTAKYETVIPRNAARVQYSSKSADEKLSRSWISDESELEIAESTLESAIGSANPETRFDIPTYIDDDDKYSDTVSHLSTGVSDILITGKTGELYGDAWGHFKIYGRVRSWDGLIVLLRVPSNSSDEHLGKWIFKGYLHNQNFVGRWRETSTPVDSVGYQGGFVVYKTS